MTLKSRPAGERSRTLLQVATDTPVAIFYLPDRFPRKLIRTGHRTVQGETIRFPRELEQRKPRLLSRFPGWLPFRNAVRTFCAELSQLPPRMTRFADDSSRPLQLWMVIPPADVNCKDAPSKVIPCIGKSGYRSHIDDRPRQTGTVGEHTRRSSCERLHRRSCRVSRRCTAVAQVN